MGILRVLLAIAVLIDHGGAILGFRLVTGAMAVEAFFIVSGFYMALVLNEKYVGTKGSYGLFLSNRLLRLFPIYWVVLLMTVLASILCLFYLDEPLKLVSYMKHYYLMPQTWVLILFTNIFIMGQDIIMFLGLNTATGSVYLTSNFLESHPNLYTYIFVHQAWSLSLEIMFYILAPFLCRRNTLILTIVAIISISIRIYVHKIGLVNDPWTYRFFPSELMFFVIGIFCYKAYVHLKSYDIPNSLLCTSLCIVILPTVLYQFVPNRIVFQMVYYAIFAIFLPFVFILTKKSRIDYRIGELSYPIYIAHLLILFLLQVLQKHYYFSQSCLSFLLILTTILFSLVLIRLVADPIERIRQRRVSNRSTVLPKSAS